MKKITQKNKIYKERYLNTFSSLSGFMSFLGGWQVCHSLCLGIIALLSLIGITAVGMPLLFLTEYAVYFWIIAVLLLIPTLIIFEQTHCVFKIKSSHKLYKEDLIYHKNRKCMSTKIILLNIGIVIASIPFASLKNYQIAFWLIGGIIIFWSFWLFLRPKITGI